MSFLKALRFLGYAETVEAVIPCQTQALLYMSR